MEIIKPSLNGFTIYSKSGCINCVKLKNVLKEKHLIYNVIDCDEYILEDKHFFLSLIKEISNNKILDNTIIYFPIVFNDNIYIGSYNEANRLINRFISFEDITF